MTNLERIPAERDRRPDHTRSEELMRMAAENPQALMSFVGLMSHLRGTHTNVESALAEYLLHPEIVNHPQPNDGDDDVSLPPAA